MNETFSNGERPYVSGAWNATKPVLRSSKNATARPLRKVSSKNL